MKDDVTIRNAIMLNERILGCILFHLFVCLSGCIYMLGRDSLVEMTRLLIYSSNHTIPDMLLERKESWVYRPVIDVINVILHACIRWVRCIQSMYITSLEILFVSCKYGVLSACCICMIVGTIITFTCMKVYRCEIEFGIFGIKIRN